MIGLNSMSVAVWTRMNEQGLPMWGDTEAEQAQYGTSRKALVFTRSRGMTTTELLRLRGQLFTQLVDIDQQIVESMKGKDYPCIANVDGNYLHLSEKSARLSYELPLIVRPATVIGD